MNNLCKFPMKYGYKFLICYKMWTKCTIIQRATNFQFKYSWNEWQCSNKGVCSTWKFATAGLNYLTLLIKVNYIPSTLAKNSPFAMYNYHMQTTLCLHRKLLRYSYATSNLTIVKLQNQISTSYLLISSLLRNQY